MKKSSEIKRGQSISFRIPSDTSDYILKQLQQLKEIERRNFSSKIAEFVIRGVNEEAKKEQETITIPLPKRLTKAQRNWIKHEHSEALLGSILYHLLSDPGRSTALLASMNSSATDIDEALYLQEETVEEQAPSPVQETTVSSEKLDEEAVDEGTEDELDAINWNTALSESRESEETEEADEDNLDDLLGDFLDKMNK